MLHGKTATPSTALLDEFFRGRHDLWCYASRRFLDAQTGRWYGACACSNRCAECLDISYELRAYGLTG